MLEFRLHFDEARLRRLFSDIERQIPYAMSVALNSTAFQAVDKLRAELDQHFTIRSPWTAKGIRVQKASKRQLWAVVGSRDEYMARQALGGRKEPARGGRMVAIPLAIRRSRTDTTPRSKWPGALLRRRGHHTRPLSGDGAGLFGPKGQLLYVLKPSVQVEPIWPFLPTVEEVIAGRWATNARAAMERALRTAR